VRTSWWYRRTQVPRKIYKAGEIRNVESKVLIAPPRLTTKKLVGEEYLEEPAEVEELERPEHEETAPAPPADKKEEADRLLEDARTQREQAESEAKRIREEAEEAAFKIVQKSNVDERKAREDAESEAARIVGEAQSKAAQIEAEASQKADSILQEAKRQAADQGREEGYRSGEEEVNRLIGRLHDIINAAIDERQSILKRTERQVVDLVLMIARKVVKIIAENEKRVVLENVREAMKKVEGDTEVTIRVNTRDLNLVTRHKKQFIAAVESLKQVHIEEDSRIEAGGCVIVTTFGDIDARIQNQLGIIEERIRELTPLGE
jgi:flagellar assembly protein FliH